MSLWTIALALISMLVCACTSGAMATEGRCGDALDDDGDGQIDCGDADCHALEMCRFGGAAITEREGGTPQPESGAPSPTSDSGSKDSGPPTLDAGADSGVERVITQISATIPRSIDNEATCLDGRLECGSDVSVTGYFNQCSCPVDIVVKVLLDGTLVGETAEKQGDSAAWATEIALMPSPTSKVSLQVFDRDPGSDQLVYGCELSAFAEDLVCGQTFATKIQPTEFKVTATTRP